MGVRTSKLFVYFLVAALAFALGFLAASGSSERVLETFPVDPQAADALKRWSEKSGQGRLDYEDYAFDKMFIPARNQGDGEFCVSVRPKAPELGGIPVYCYRNGTTELSREYSNVE